MYQALYRKYRSKVFDELVGQQAIVSALKHQVQSGEISHAYLFSGTRGTGKTSAAKILSRAVNCLHPQDGNPCNTCEACLGILNDTVMDVVEMDAASNNGVDDIRELKEKVVYPPTSVKYKVYIIDEVHMLSKGAFNALLKILEEPPKHLIFILATTEPEKIPSTILSRTQKFNFKRIAVEQIVENLKRIAESEQKSCDEEVYQLIAKNSDGAMRDALSLLDQLLSYSEEHISYEMAIEVLGISSNEHIFTLSQSLVEHNVNGVMEALNQLAQEGKDYVTLTRDLLKHFRDLMLLMTLQNPEEFVVTSHQQEFAAQKNSATLSEVFDIIENLKEVQKNIRYVDDPKILLEMNLIRICTQTSKENLLKRLEILEQSLPQKSSVPTQAKEQAQSWERNEYLPGDAQSSVKTGQVTQEERISSAQQKVDRTQVQNRVAQDVGISSPSKPSISSTGKIENGENSDIMVNSVLSLSQIQSDWGNILNDMKAMRRINVAALLKEAQPLAVKNNVLEIGFLEKFEFHLRAVSTEENLKFIEHVLKERYNTDVEVRTVIVKEEPMKKLYALFGQENIEEI